jgi:DNA processing protein
VALDPRAYWVAFHRIPYIGAARVRALLEAFGDLERAWNASDGELASVGFGPSTLHSLVTGRRNVDPAREWRRASEAGVRVITWLDRNYPTRLRRLAIAPPVLFVRGEIGPADETAVALVGTRQPSPYGVGVAAEFAGELARSGVTIVSGLARGIDSVGHRGALDAGGRTIAVLGSGLDKVYPREHRDLADRIAGQGAVLSDYALGTGPDPRNFPPRNRLISGLSLAVIVVEAGEESGALLTAEFAAEQGTEVFAIPGPIHARASRGTNRLLARGARPALAPQDILEALAMAAPGRTTGSPQAEVTEPSDIRILEVLEEGPLHVDELQHRCGRSSSEIAAALALLEIQGVVQQVGGMQYARVRETGRAYSVE